MQNDVSTGRVLLKGLLLFSIFEIVILSIQPTYEAFSMYALFNLQRQRFPISTIAPTDDALDVGSLGAMFASHVVSRGRNLPMSFEFSCWETRPYGESA